MIHMSFLTQQIDTDFDKNKITTYSHRIKKIPWPRCVEREESCRKKKKMAYIILFFSDDSISRLRSPVVQRPFSPKKGIPLSKHVPQPAP